MKTNRNTLVCEEATVVAHEDHPAGQHILHVVAPRIAAVAEPGSFVHLRCAQSLDMRRPISIMRAHANDGWIDLLYKEVGLGTRALAAQAPGATLNMIGPIGQPFRLRETHPRPLLIGGGVGIPPILFLAERMVPRLNELQPFMIMGSEVPFPFELTRTTSKVAGVRGEVDASLALTQGWGIDTRLSTLRGYEGCHQGYVTELARGYLDALTDGEREEVAVYSCGPTPMLAAVAELAREYELPCQVSLEEYMACAVGGCAGCTVRVREAGGEAMKRVCVDGPVFEAAQVFF